MKAEQQKSERRRATRIPLSIPTKAKAKGPVGNSDYQEMITKDISNKGAYLLTPQPYPMASELRLILDLGKLLVRAVGSVVRVDSAGMAVAFSRTEVAAVRM